MFEPPAHDVLNRLAQFASARLAPMAYDPKNGYFFAQGTNSLMWLGPPDDPFAPITNVKGIRVPNYPNPTVAVAAIEGRTGQVVWKKDLPTFDDSGYKSNGGSLATAGGLLFHQGGDGTLQAYDSRNGERVWQFQTDYAVGDASPMTYAVDGKQYVAFVAGSKVWAFALGGQMPQAAPIPTPPYEAIKGPIQDTQEIETLTLEPVGGTNGRRYRLNEYAFNPYRARVRAGTPVTFINNGYLPHTIAAQDGSWNTGTLMPTQIATLTFDKPGAYLYTSKEYPFSYGEVIVVATTDSSASTAVPATAEQVNLGKASYASSCAACHGAALTGQDRAPALVGSAFSTGWIGRDALSLFDRIRTTMPPTAPASLSDEAYAALVSFILYSNDRPVPLVLDRQNMKALLITPR
jgi:plastocyanin/cytochrome c5